MTYQYQGSHTGPDLFDTATRSDDALPSPYEQAVKGERDALIAYLYARGFHDQEIAEQIGGSAKSVVRWRERRGLRSNFDLVVRL